MAADRGNSRLPVILAAAGPGRLLPAHEQMAYFRIEPDADAGR
jgi:hypothetical protein